MSSKITFDTSRLGESNARTALLLKLILLVLVTAGLVYFTARSFGQSDRDKGLRTSFDSQIKSNAQQMFEDGRQIFRYDTFGDEAYWTDQLKLHQAIQGSQFGGVGPGVSPKTALAVGLKVDMDELPEPLVNQIKQGKVNLDGGRIPEVLIASFRDGDYVSLRGSDA